MSVVVVRLYITHVTSGVEHLVKKMAIFWRIEMCIPVLCHEVDVDVIFLDCSPLFIEADSLVPCWTSPIPVSLASQLVLRICSWILGLQVSEMSVHCLCDFWGFEVRSSCLLSKIFTNELSPQPFPSLYEFASFFFSFLLGCTISNDVSSESLFFSYLIKLILGPL